MENTHNWADYTSISTFKRSTDRRHSLSWNKKFLAEYSFRKLNNLKFFNLGVSLRIVSLFSPKKSCLPVPFRSFHHPWPECHIKLLTTFHKYEPKLHHLLKVPLRCSVTCVIFDPCTIPDSKMNSWANDFEHLLSSTIEFLFQIDALQARWTI